MQINALRRFTLNNMKIYSAIFILIFISLFSATIEAGESKVEKWPFDQTENTAAITTRQVLEENKDICIVIHYSDDHSWAFLCGTTNSTEDGRVISMKQATKIDNTLLEIAELPPGWDARREKKGTKWHRSKSEE